MSIEPVTVVGFLMLPDMHEPYIDTSRDWHCPGHVEPLMTVAQHERIVAGLQAKKDYCAKTRQSNYTASLRLEGCEISNTP